MKGVVHASQAAAVPWKNGGGVTRHLLSDAAGEAWRWRISLAAIDRDGPFSAYPGVERWFAVVSGAGVRLAFGQRVVEIGAKDEAIRFDGAQAPGCTLIGGSTRDLNLMLRGGARGAMRRGVWDAQWQQAWPMHYCFDTDTLALRALLPLPHSGRGSKALWIGLAP